MKVTLLNNTPLVICSHAIRTCWNSHDKSDNGREKDKSLIDRVGNKFKHASTLEHLVYNFYIEDVSRALLQEFARHRMASLSVKSTRYTLKELKDEEPFIWVASEEEKENYDIYTVIDDFGVEYCLSNDVHDRFEKYLVITDIIKVNFAALKALEQLRLTLNQGVSNDKAKYILPESYKTELSWTINARSLQNFLSLRSDKSALWEIQDLAHKVFDALPRDHQYLFKESIKNHVSCDDNGDIIEFKTPTNRISKNTVISIIFIIGVFVCIKLSC